MLEKTTIARPYAEAVFEQAQSENALKSWSELLAALKAIVSDPQLRGLLQNPRVSSDQLVEIITGVVGEGLSKTQANFVQLVTEAERLQFVPEMAQLFEQRRLDVEGLANVEVVSAYPLEEAQRERVVEIMGRRLSRKIELSERTDEGLIGGVIIRRGDSVIDASIRGQLNELRNELA